MSRNNQLEEYSPEFFDMMLKGRMPNTKYVIPYENASHPTQGWRELAPKLKSQRINLINNCGPGCFLSPWTLGYPVCSKKMDCVPHCSGILSAKIRASQWKHPEIATIANKLLQKKCLK
jgi:hypothetical protein